LRILSHPQPHQPKRQQTAQFGAALGRRHKVGVQGVGAFHHFAQVIVHTQGKQHCEGPRDLETGQPNLQP